MTSGLAAFNFVTTENFGGKFLANLRMRTMRKKEEKKKKRKIKLLVT